MARILTRNLYELTSNKLDRLLAQKEANLNNKVPKTTKAAGANRGSNKLIKKEFQRLKQFKEFQDDNIVMGGLHRLRYSHFQHDAEPLALFFNETKNMDGEKVIPALNLHYLVTRESTQTLDLIRKFNAPRMALGFPPALIWEMAKLLPWDLIPYRLYKVSGIKPLEYIPLDSWDRVVGKERSRWQGFSDF